MAAKKAPAKKATQRSSSRAASDIVGPGGRNPLTAATNKAAKDARGRASKYGTPMGPTQVDVFSTKKRGDNNVTATTRVKVPGGYLDVVENKLQRFAGRDSKRSTTVSGATNKKSKAGDLGSQRAAQRAKKKK